MPIEVEHRYIEDPLVIVYPDHGSLIFRIHPRASDTYASYGAIACVLVREIAAAFKVDEDEVWEWVDEQRQHPTCPIRTAS